MVSGYDPSHPEAGTTEGPWPTAHNPGLASSEWVDPKLQRACEFYHGITRSSVPNGRCISGAPGATTEPRAIGGPPADVAAGVAPGGGPTQGAPDTLTDTQRADILAAVDGANAAWATASQTLDGAALNGSVAGQELTDDLAELGKLRSQGHMRKNINTAFAVTDVTLEAPGHAIVRTQETWYAEIYSVASGQLLQRTPPATYDETYTVEYLNGGWIVTKNVT
jgi:hypothetical protein